MRKTLITAELANGFPSYTKIRSDEQSVGQSLLNVIGAPVEQMFTELYRAYDNFYLTTANVSEIDITYRVQLPESFNFELDRTDVVEPLQIAPTVSGLIDNTWYLIDEIESGKIKDFWYEGIPTRYSTGETISGVDYLLVDTTSDAVTVSGIPEMFSPNQLLISVSGTRFFDADHKDLPRARIRITGTTWKGTQETEDLIFMFNGERLTEKTWQNIDHVDFVDFPEVADIKIFSHMFNLEDYLDPYDDMQQQSDSRFNLPVFWSIGTNESGVNYLEQKRYQATTAFDLLNNQVNKIETRRWELLVSGVNIVPVDLIPIPYSQRAWILSTSGIYLFDLDMNLPNQQLLTERTVGPSYQLEVSSDYAIREDDVEINLVANKFSKTLVKHRFSIKYPDGTLLYLLDEDLYDPTIDTNDKDFWSFDIQDDRYIRSSILMSFSDRGEHILTLETYFLDKSIEVDQRVLIIDSKNALFDSSITLDNVPVGVCIDHLHRLWVLTASNSCTEIIPNYDTMLVDYTGKQLVFREAYDEVKVTK